MIRSIKALGLVLSAAVALGALSAATASAVDFHSEATHTELRGEQHAAEDVFAINAGTVRCSHITYSGTETSATTTTQSVLPSYTGCKAFGFINTVIDVNGCSYRFDASANNVDIVCGATPITVTAFSCWVTIGTQENIGSVTFTNNGSGKTRDVTVDVNLTGLTYTQHSKSFPGCTNGSFTNGTYTGSATVRGFDTASEPVGIWAG